MVFLFSPSSAFQMNIYILKVKKGQSSLLHLLAGSRGFPGAEVRNLASELPLEGEAGRSGAKGGQDRATFHPPWGVRICAFSILLDVSAG